VNVLAKAVAYTVRNGDKTALENYSDTVVSRICMEKELSASMTDAGYRFLVLRK
jgi:hypothetical protein